MGKVNKANNGRRWTEWHFHIVSWSYRKLSFSSETSLSPWQPNRSITALLFLCDFNRLSQHKLWDFHTNLLQSVLSWGHISVTLVTSCNKARVPGLKGSIPAHPLYTTGVDSGAQIVIFSYACVETYGESVSGWRQPACLWEDGERGGEGGRGGGRWVAIKMQDYSGCAPIGGTLPFCDWLQPPALASTPVWCLNFSRFFRSSGCFCLLGCS